MSWSIQQVARLSGVTARTLRHYDDIGLLRPARVGANGYRYYEQAELLRLQQILLLHEDGVAATDPAVFAVLDDDVEGSRKLMTVDRETYAALGEAFATAPELRAHLDARDPHLADYLRDAMVAYADTRMG